MNNSNTKKAVRYLAILALYLNGSTYAQNNNYNQYSNYNESNNTGNNDGNNKNTSNNYGNNDNASNNNASNNNASNNNAYNNYGNNAENNYNKENDTSGNIKNNYANNNYSSAQGGSGNQSYSSNADGSIDSENNAATNDYGSDLNIENAGLTNDYASNSTEGTLSLDSTSEAGPLVEGLPPNSVNLDPVPEPNEFSGVPPMPGTLRLMAVGEAPTQYTVQEGDTLFDICDQLLDEETYWPKLWSLNPNIKNPHFIYPGMILRFYPGDDLLPPFLEVENENDLVPIDRGGLSESDLVKAPLPPEDIDPVYITDPVAVLTLNQVPDMPEEYTYIGAPRISTTININVPVFVFSEEKEELAEVLGGLEGEINLGVGQRALVEVEDGVSAGQTYTILRFTEEVENPLTDDFVGYRYQNKGIAVVEKLIEDGDRAIINIKSTEFGVQNGDILVGYISSIRKIPIKTNRRNGPAADATIIAFGDPFGRVASQGQYVVLDNPSLSVGSDVGLFRAPVQFGNPVNSDYTPTELDSVGVLRIVDSTDAASVGYILYASTAVVPGDRTSPENLIDR